MSTQSDETGDVIESKLSDVMWIDVDELNPHPKNPNRHSEAQISRLAEILKYQGWRYPIKVSANTGYITSGHGRLMAARRLGIKKVPVMVQEYEDSDQEMSDIISDNAIASWAELDLSMVNTELKEFDPSFDLNLLGIEGFTLDPSDKIKNTSGELDIDQFNQFKHQCPKCGFEWDDQQSTEDGSLETD